MKINLNSIVKIFFTKSKAIAMKFKIGKIKSRFIFD